MSNPLAALQPKKLYINKVENVSVGHLAEQTLLNVNGPGNVVSVWMALGGGNGPALDGRLRVYYDGSASTAIDVDLGTLLATHYGAAGHHHAGHVRAEIVGGSNYNTGFIIKFPMPFGQCIRIAYYNPSTTQNADIYSMCTYYLSPTDEANGQRLYAQGTRVLDSQVTRTAGQVTTFASVAGGPGSVVYHSQVGGLTATNLSWLERNMAFFIDGETVASLQATGTEDWFDSAWYFEGWKDFGGPDSYVGADNAAAYPNVVGMMTDFMSKWGGVPFQTGFVFQALTEAACTTGDKLTYVVLYYQ